MDEAFIYLIKVNIALVVFYLFYRHFMGSDPRCLRRNWAQVYGELSIMYEGRLPE